MLIVVKNKFIVIYYNFRHTFDPYAVRTLSWANNFDMNYYTATDEVNKMYKN